MKQLNKYILFSFLSLAAVGCINEEEIAPATKDEAVEKVHMTFTASIEDNADTKTILGTSDEYGYRKILWQPGDSIAVGYYGTLNKFVNVKEENSSTAIFEGEDADREVYYAIYPYQEDQYISWDPGYQFYLPAVQKYAEGTFAPESNIMIGKAGRGEDLKFTSVCGMLVIKLTGEEKIKSISLTAKTETGEQAKLSGKFSAAMDWVESPVLTPDQSAGTMITLDCAEGVQLNPAEPTGFYFVLPPATYSKFTLTIGTTDGKVMLKEGKNLDITRAEYRTASTLPFAAEVAFDLSAKGTANCYIVTEAGLYSFDAGTIGNGEFGLASEDDYMVAGSIHTTNASIYPESAEILWSDGRNPIGGFNYDKENHRVNFVATGEKGNAVIVAKDADGKILWSWHIWATDEPQEHRYINNWGEFTVLDRNLGALRNNGGASDAENRESIGTMYQWGRKDPFYAVSPENSWDWTLFYTRKSTRLTTEESIELPTTLAGYDEWNRNSSSYLWSRTTKTIYDPCPAGYRVAVTDVFRGFTKEGYDVDRGSDINYAGSFDKGFEFYYDGSNTAWYPVTTYHYYYNWNTDYSENSSYIWSADQNAFYFYYNDEYECSIRVSSYESKGHAFPVRCMKDDATASIMVKIDKTDHKNIQATSASVSGKVSVYGDLEVINAGFVIGNSVGVDLTNGRKIESASKKGVIKADITGLTPMTRYYLKAFATTANGTTYSEAISFYTPNNEGVVDLSSEGRANSYIVPPAYSVYTIDAVKGNSNTSVGAVASAEVLWETYNTTEEVVPNSIIASAEFDGSRIKFTMPEVPVSGNAVIAAKDADGTILWSWHIWVTDYDPVATQQKYGSGAIMMDRNLGALSGEPYSVSDGVGSANEKSFGLYYQWGRKDPFPGVTGSSSWEGYNPATTYPENPWVTIEKGSYDESISNPRAIFIGTDWNKSNNLWTPDKTIYDPCPSGWRIPDGNPGVWSNIETHSSGTGVISVTTGGITAYYPANGYYDPYYNHYGYGDGAYCYSCSTGPMEGDGIHVFHINYYGYDTYMTYSRDSQMSVRCQRMDISDKEGDGDDYEVDDDYIWD